MKKGDKTPPQIIVEYKGTEFKLPAGHSVWMITIDEKEMVGVVTRAKLHRSRSLAFWKKPRYHVKEIKNVEYIPAFDIEKARTRFKNFYKTTGLTVK